MTEESYLPISECKERHIYRLHSRNLAFGVFAPERDNGFIGIRTKFGARYLATEYHWDNGPPYGTAKPLEDVGIIKEPRIRLVEDDPDLCRFCGERAKFIKEDDDPKSYKGEWIHIGGDGLCSPAQVVRPKNRALFGFLESLEQEHGTQPPKEWRDVSWRNK